MSNLKFSLNPGENDDDDDDNNYEDDDNSEVSQPMSIAQFLECLSDKDKKEFVHTYSSSIGSAQKPFKPLAKELTISIRETVFPILQSSIDSLANGTSPKYLFHSLDFLHDSICYLTKAYNHLSKQASNFLETEEEQKELELYFEEQLTHSSRSSRDSPSNSIISAPTIQIRTFNIAIPDGKSSEE